MLGSNIGQSGVRCQDVGHSLSSGDFVLGFGAACFLRSAEKRRYIVAMGLGYGYVVKFVWWVVSCCWVLLGLVVSCCWGLVRFGCPW